MPVQSAAVAQGWAPGSAGRGVGSGRGQEAQSARAARRKMRTEGLRRRRPARGTTGGAWGKPGSALERARAVRRAVAGGAVVACDAGAEIRPAAGPVAARGHVEERRAVGVDGLRVVQ